MKKMILESVKDTEDIHSLLTMIQEENTSLFIYIRKKRGYPLQ